MSRTHLSRHASRGRSNASSTCGSYLLDPEGKDPGKARYFASLGYTRENWQELRDVVLDQLPQVEGRLERTNAGGWQNWAARIVLPGPERPAEVETIWEVRPDRPPRLVTAFPGR